MSVLLYGQIALVLKQAEVYDSQNSGCATFAILCQNVILNNPIILKFVPCSHGYQNFHCKYLLFYTIYAFTIWYTFFIIWLTHVSFHNHLDSTSGIMKIHTHQTMSLNTSLCLWYHDIWIFLVVYYIPYISSECLYNIPHNTRSLWFAICGWFNFTVSLSTIYILYYF